MARRLATAISQAPGLAGTPVLGHSDEGDDQRVLRQFLGKVDIAHDAGQARDEPGPFNAKDRFDRLMRLACGHAALSAKAISEASRPPPTVSDDAELLARPIRRRFPRASGVRNSGRSATS